MAASQSALSDPRLSEERRLATLRGDQIKPGGRDPDRKENSL
jgi:hypothetical protein